MTQAMFITFEGFNRVIYVPEPAPLTFTVVKLTSVKSPENLRGATRAAEERMIFEYVGVLGTMPVYEQVGE